MHDQQAQFSNLAQLYETDYARWLDETIEQLKAREFDALDLPDLIEELADMGRSQKQALASNLRVLLQYLLKWAYQPERRTNSWQATITEHRMRVRDLLADSPSLKPELERLLSSEYTKARKLAAQETGLPLGQFPAEAPFNLEQILDEDFWPQP